MNARQERTLGNIVANIKFLGLKHVEVDVADWYDGEVRVSIEARRCEDSVYTRDYRCYIGVRGGAYAYVPTRNDGYRRVYSRTCSPLAFEVKY